MTPVVVNEETIKSVSHEQDLIVRLPWVAEQSLEAKNRFSFAPKHFDDYASVFKHHLSLPSEDSYPTSAGTWSDVADDTSISRSHTFAQSPTLLPEAGVQHEGYHQQCHMISGEQEVDFASFTFDGHSNGAIQASSLFSASTSKVSQLAAPLPFPQGNLPSQAEVWHASAVEDEGVAFSAPSGQTMPASPKPVLSSHRPSAPSSLAAEASSLSRDYKPTPTIERKDFGAEPPNRIKNDTNAANSLERNRLAAMKCRRNRKEKVEKLLEQSDKNLQLNAGLRYEIERLKAEITEAKGLLKMHIGCS